MRYVVALMSTVVWLLLSSQCGNTQQFNVVPDDEFEKFCDQESDEFECDTLAFYMNSSKECPLSYFNSHEIYVFWNGTHTPLANNVLKVNNVTNLTFTVHSEEAEAVIDCNGESVGFIFVEFSDIRIENLVFLSCIRISSTAERGHHALAMLAFLNGTNLYLTKVTLKGSVDEALYVHNIQGMTLQRDYGH